MPNERLGGACKSQVLQAATPDTDGYFSAFQSGLEAVQAHARIDALVRSVERYVHCVVGAAWQAA